MAIPRMSRVSARENIGTPGDSTSTSLEQMMEHNCLPKEFVFAFKSSCKRTEISLKGIAHRYAHEYHILNLYNGN